MPRILVVEDDGALRFDLAQTIMEWGFETKSVPSAVRGIRLVKEWKPHLVLSDIYMPHVTGYELKQQISKLNIPATEMGFIFMTQLHQSQIDFRSSDVRADEYISKPIDYRMLRTKIEAALQRVRTSQPLEVYMAQEILARFGAGTHS